MQLQLQGLVIRILQIAALLQLHDICCRKISASASLTEQHGYGGQSTAVYISRGLGREVRS